MNLSQGIILFSGSHFWDLVTYKMFEKGALWQPKDKISRSWVTHVIFPGPLLTGS
jgi:hypothetical protein